MRKELLLEVTFEKFAQKGYNTTLSEIAQGAGIKKQSIYNHFHDKDELLYTTIENELLNFYTTKSLEFENYMQLTPKDALGKMFYSICSYYREINRLKFWRWILLIESKQLFMRCRDLIRANEKTFYNRVKILLEQEFCGTGTTEDDHWKAVQTFVVLIHGVLDGMLLNNEIYSPDILIENAWSFYWKGIERLKNNK